jgi:hypothetical protein
VLGFEQIESPNFGDFDVIWLRVSPSLTMHIIQRDPQSKLPVGPYAATSSVRDPKQLPRGHHVSFSVSNFDSVVKKLKVINKRRLRQSTYRYDIWIMVLKKKSIISSSNSVL